MAKLPSTDTESRSRPVPRKRRQPARRVPSALEVRERRPFIFGWGADLNQREREALKERIALFGGIGLAVVLALVIGWGAYQDNVAAPAARARAENQAVASVGSYIVRMGFFKHFEAFQQGRIDNQIQQVQQNIAALNPKKDSSKIAQLQAYQSQLQQQTSTLATDSLTALLNDGAVMQGASSLGIVETQKDADKALQQAEKQTGGYVGLLRNIAPSGLSFDDIKWLIKADDMSSRVYNKLAARLPRYQTQVRVSHILVKSKSLGQKIYQEVLHGANFSALAAKYSVDTADARKGGDLGFFGRGKMVKPFENAAFSMKIGEIRLVHSQFGWHIMKLTGRRTTHLTGTSLQTAEQSAFNSWVQKEQGILGVHRFVPTSQLPQAAATSTTSSLGGVQQVPAGSTSQQVPGSTTGQQVPAQTSGQSPSTGTKAKTGKKR